MTKILGCKPKWMMLSLQLRKAKGQCDKFSVVEVDGVLWLFVFVSLSVWLHVMNIVVFIIGDVHAMCSVQVGVSSMVHCVLEEVSCLVLMKVRWCGSDKKEDIKI